MGKQGMVDENRFAEEMYTSVRRMDLQILRSKHISDLAGLLTTLVGS
jgi:hypothetical protein